MITLSRHQEKTMKKAISFAFAALLIITSSTSEASLQQRLQWWQARSLKLNEIHERLSADRSTAPEVLDVIEYERRGAREALAIFESYTGNPTRLMQTERLFTGKELSDRTALVTGPLFSLLYLELMVNGAGDRESLDRARRAVTNRLQGMEPCAECGINEISGEVLGRDITPGQWKVLAMELYFGSLMESRTAIRKALEEYVTAALVDHVQGSGKSTLGEIDNIILKETLAWMPEHAPAMFSDESAGSLEKSWCWRTISRDLENWRASCSEIRRLLPADGQVGALRMKYLMNYIPELDAHIFGEFGKECIDAACAAVRAEDSSAHAAPSLKALMAGLIEEIDAIRKSRAQSITGRESDDYFKALSKDFDSAVSGKISASERPRPGRDHKNGNTGPSGLAAALEQAKKYAERSRAFLAWLSHTRRMEASEMPSLYRYRIDRSAAYIGFMKDLAAGASGLTVCESRNLSDRFTTAVSRTYNVLKSVEAAVSPDRKMITRMTAREITACRELKRDFHARSTEAGHDISAQLQKFISSTNESSSLARSTDGNLKNKIAQYEIDHFVDTARMCSRSHDALRYDEDALSAYRESFIRMKTEAAGGNSVLHRDDGPVRATIITACPGFDEGRLVAERAAKEYLKKECEDALARIGSLLGFYRRLGSALEIAPDRNEIEDIRRIISRRFTVKISSWTMDERNYREIDAKAFYEIARAARISAVRSQQASGPDNRPNRTVPINDGSLSFFLPGQWTEKKTGELDRMKGKISSYCNPLTDSSIDVASVSADGRSMQDISVEWIKREGMKPVRWKFIRKNDREFCWAVAGNGKTRIMETYAVIQEGSVIIISGETERGRRTEFSQTMAGLIGSMDF